jgi:hypothetical protein
VPLKLPLTLKPVPKVEALERVTLVFPVDVRVTLAEVLVPTVTFPKLKLVGLAEIDRDAATPVPLMEMSSVPDVLAMASFPLTDPAASGVKIRLSVVVPPPASVSGVDKPVALKPPLGTVTEEMVTSELREFFS